MSTHFVSSASPSAPFCRLLCPTFLSHPNPCPHQIPHPEPHHQRESRSPHRCHRLHRHIQILRISRRKQRDPRIHIRRENLGCDRRLPLSAKHLDGRPIQQDPHFHGAVAGRRQGRVVDPRELRGERYIAGRGAVDEHLAGGEVVADGRLGVAFAVAADVEAELLRVVAGGESQGDVEGFTSHREGQACDRTRRVPGLGVDRRNTVQGIQFRIRRRNQRGLAPDGLERQFARHGHGAAPRGSGRDERVGPVAHPCDGDALVVGEAVEAGHGVVVRTVVEPVGAKGVVVIQAAGVGGEVLAVEVADEVLHGGGAGEGGAAVLDPHGHDPFEVGLVAVEGEGEDAGAFPEAVGGWRGGRCVSTSGVLRSKKGEFGGET